MQHFTRTKSLMHACEICYIKTAQVESPQLTAKLKQLLTVLHHVTHAQKHTILTLYHRPAPVPRTHSYRRDSTASPKKKRQFFFPPLCWKHNLCVAALNSAQGPRSCPLVLQYHRPALQPSSSPPPLRSLPRPGAGGGTPAAGWTRPWLSARPTPVFSAEVCSGTRRRRRRRCRGRAAADNLTATCTAVSGRDG